MLALIAGQGELPAALVARLPQRPLVCAMQGFAPDIAADLTFRLEHLGSLLTVLHKRGVRHICMAGAVRRPPIDPTEIDAATVPLVNRIVGALAKGDDGALRAIIAIFEEAGFTVVGAHEIAPDLIPPVGVLTTTGPSPETPADARCGQETLLQMGAADSGQACVLRAGEVLVREDAAGTDAMLARLRRAEGADGIDARGAILFKGPKPQQDRRADLPVIGPATARAAVAAGLAGIVIEAQGVMVLDLPTVIATLDQAGLFLWVREPQ